MVAVPALAALLYLLSLGLVIGGAEPQARAEGGCEGSLPLPPRPNEPGGFICITNRAFMEREEPGWRTRRGETFTIIEDRTAPVSPPRVGRARFPRGYAGGRGPINTSAELRGHKVKELYLAFWIKLPNDFEGARSAGINKVLHIWLDERSTVVLSAQGRGSGPLFPQMRLQNVRADHRGISFNLDPRRDAWPRMFRDRWYQIEVHLKVNTPGRADGVVEWWMDGRPAGEYRNVGFVKAGDESYWTEVSWNPTWGSPKDTAAREMSMLIDHFYVSARP